MNIPDLDPKQQAQIQGLAQALSPKETESGSDMQPWRIARTLNSYLLDDEQKAMLGLNPQNLFFLYGAAVLAAADLGAEETLRSRSEEIDGTDLRILSRILSGVSHPEAPALEVQEIKGGPVNIPLIVWAVRLASALDITGLLTAEEITRDGSAPGRLLPAQIIHGCRLDTAGPHPFLPGTIRLGITCRDAEVHRALKRHETRVQKLLHQANTLVSPRFLYSDIIFEIQPDGYAPLDMKFSVDSMAALRLLTGNRLYSDQRVFLRELVQNAVDACHLKQIFDPGLIPEITIAFDPDYQTITFRDNGIGMDRQWIEKYFLKVGISFYQSGDLKSVHKSRMDCHFISKFGIGFLSSFLAAQKVVIRTRKDDRPALAITINSLEDYFDVRETKGFEGTGTEVTLFLQANKIGFARSMDYLCYLKNNLRFLTIPVALTDHMGRESLIGHETFAYETLHHTGRDFVVPLDLGESEGYLFLKAKQDQGGLYGLEYARGGVSVFQDGIFVTQALDLLPEGARQNIIGRINLLGSGRCELSMDRNRIFWTDRRLSEIKRQIRLGIVDLANAVLAEVPGDEGTSLANHLAIFFDLNDLDDEMYNRLNSKIRQKKAKQFRDFIRVHAAHTGDQRQVPDADGYGEDWQKEILKGFLKRARPALEPV